MVGWGVNVCGAAVGTAAIKPVMADVGTEGVKAGLLIAARAVAGVGVVGRAGREKAGLFAAASAVDGVMEVGLDGMVIMPGVRGAAGARAMRSTLPTGAGANDGGPTENLPLGPP